MSADLLRLVDILPGELCGRDAQADARDAVHLLHHPTARQQTHLTALQLLLVQVFFYHTVDIRVEKRDFELSIFAQIHFRCTRQLLAQLRKKNFDSFHEKEIL